jgi:hypothetical protein
MLSDLNVHLHLVSLSDASNFTLLSQQNTITLPECLSTNETGSCDHVFIIIVIHKQIPFR